MSDNGSSESGEEDENNPEDEQEQQQQQVPPPAPAPGPQMPGIFRLRYRDDEYMMYDFKTRECPEWLETQLPHAASVCPLLHQGHKRRRDPREYKYYPILCPYIEDCEDGDDCEFSHNIFEYCLHPKKYKRSRCKDGVNCNTYPCMFAHNPDQLLAAMKPPLPPPPRQKPPPLEPLPPLNMPLPNQAPPVNRTRRSKSF